MVTSLLLVSISVITQHLSLCRIISHFCKEKNMWIGKKCANDLGITVVTGGTKRRDRYRRFIPLLYDAPRLTPPKPMPDVSTNHTGLARFLLIGKSSQFHSPHRNAIPLFVMSNGHPVRPAEGFI